MRAVGGFRAKYRMKPQHNHKSDTNNKLSET